MHVHTHTWTRTCIHTHVHTGTRIYLAFTAPYEVGITRVLQVGKLKPEAG